MALESQVTYNDISPALKALVKWPTDSKGKPLDRVVYQLQHNSKMWEKTPDDERVLVDTHPAYNIPNLDTIYDADAGQHVQLAYFTTLRPAKAAWGETGPQPALLTIDFTPDNRGFLYVTHRQKTLFMFMELTNANSDSVNPDREKPSMGHLFSRVKPEVIAEMQIDRKAEIYRVGGIVLTMSVAQMQVLAPKVDVNAQLDEKELRHELLKRVEADPYLVNNCLDSEQVKIEEEVRNAIGRKLIEYSGSAGGFLWYHTREVFALIPAGTVDTVDALVSYLGGNADGKKVRDSIREKLAKKGKPTAPSAQSTAGRFTDTELNNGEGNGEDDEDYEPNRDTELDDDDKAPRKPAAKKKPAAPRKPSAKKAAKAAPKVAAAPAPAEAS